MRQTALNLCLLAAVAALTVLGANTWAKTPSEGIDVIPYTVEAKYDQANQDLIVKVTEIAESPNACDLVVSGLAYASDSQTLSLKLDSDFCPVDRIGHRAATLIWHLPMSLRGSGELNLQANGAPLGKLVFEQNNNVLSLKQ